MNLNRATLLSDALKKDETGPCQAQPAKTIRRKKSLKKPLTLRSDALQKDDERPAQPPDCALQAAAEPGQKYGSMAASPYRQMKKGQRRPHGVGPKDPKHGFFGALPLRQRGRRISGSLVGKLPISDILIRTFVHPRATCILRGRRSPKCYVFPCKVRFESEIIDLRERARVAECPFHGPIMLESFSICGSN